jgi:hypothetical protein
MAYKNRPRITISKTPTEWKVIDDKLSELKKANLNTYLRSKLHSFIKEYRKSHKQVCQSLEKKRSKREDICAEDFEILEVISLKTGLSVAQIVNQIIIDPLIRSNGKES